MKTKNEVERCGSHKSVAGNSAAAAAGKVYRGQPSRTEFITELELKNSQETLTVLDGEITS